jgi:ATP synthase protein I
MNPKTTLGQEIGSKAARKLHAQSHGSQTAWFGLGMMGLIGWSVAVPTLLGAALGIWLDKHHSGSYSWTLMLLLIGLLVGCLNAWHWVSKEDREMHNEHDTTEQEHLDE